MTEAQFRTIIRTSADTVAALPPAEQERALMELRITARAMANASGFTASARQRLADDLIAAICEQLPYSEAVPPVRVLH